MERTHLPLLAAVLLAALPTHAHAVFTFTLTQTGNDVSLTGAGSLNTTGLTGTTVGGTSGFEGDIAFLRPDGTGVSFFSGVTGPANFGAGSTRIAASNVVGDHVGIVGNAGRLYAPTGYVSGDPLTETATFANQTFATLGFTPGTYTFTFNTGANTDTLIVTGAVPEPSTWAFVAAGTGLLGFGALRRRRAVRLA